MNVIGYCQTRELTQDEWFALYQKTLKDRDDARAEASRMRKISELMFQEALAATKEETK